jgi:hypothetical protein
VLSASVSVSALAGSEEGSPRILRFTHDSQARIPTKVAVAIGFRLLVRPPSYTFKEEYEEHPTCTRGDLPLTGYRSLPIEDQVAYDDDW